MSHLFPSLPEHPHLADVYRAFPQQLVPLLHYHDLLLRGESPLSIAERELIAAYVSGLNACAFCHGAHRLYAQAFGIDAALIDELMQDIDTATVDTRLKPILRYVAKLRLLPPRLTRADAAAGRSERALFDAIQVAALFNYMNRIIEGTGVSFDYTTVAATAEELAMRRTRSYADFGRQLGISVPAATLIGGGSDAGAAR